MAARPGACITALAATLACMPAGAADAAAGTVFLAQAPSGSAGSRSSGGAADDRYGTRASGMPFDREVRLGTDTRSIGVWRFETINFVTADGHAFRWRFDTARELDAFPLASIAPAELNVPAQAKIYVNGEIPIAP
jgi:hypothetical protein